MRVIVLLSLLGFGVRLDESSRLNIETSSTSAIAKLSVAVDASRCGSEEKSNHQLGKDVSCSMGAVISLVWYGS